MCREWVLKILRNQWKCWYVPDVKFFRNFKRNCQPLKNIVLMLMLWKRPNPTQGIASASVRQGPSHRSSFADWRRDCFRKFLVNDMYPPFVLKSQKVGKESGEFIHTGSEIVIPDPILFIPDTILFIPDLILFLPDPNLLICYWLFQRFRISRLSWPFIWNLFILGLKIQR